MNKNQESKKLDPKLEPGWKEILKAEFGQEWMAGLKRFLVEEKKNNVVYPPGDKIFAAYNTTPWDKVRVIILGQDPYHGPNQAEGLCFSVPREVKMPPSLKNIYKEICQEFPDYAIDDFNHGHLGYWAQQGVFLLNTVLTVRAHQAASHRNQGWEKLTDATITQLSRQKSNLVFLLWGSFAIAKADLIDQKKHLVLQAPHPSPLSAYRGFFGCNHFSQCNQYLNDKGFEPIDWNINS